MDKTLLLYYLTYRRQPLAQYEGGIHLHNGLCEAAPEFYARLLADPVTDVSHKREVLLNLLWNPAVHEVERRRILDMLYALPVAEAMQVVEVIRQQRINRSRTHELLLAFLIGHKQFPLMAATRKQRVTHLLKHALGEQTWSAAKRFLADSTPEGEAFLQRELLRYAWHGNTVRARETLCFLAGVPFEPSESLLQKSLAARANLERGEGLPMETLLGLRGIYHKRFSVRRIRGLAETPAEIVRIDGSLTALYKEMFSNSSMAEVTKVATSPTVAPVAPPSETPETSVQHQEGLVAVLRRAIERLLAQATPFAHQTADEQPVSSERGGVGYDLAGSLVQAVEAIPLIEARLAIVLDLSASMASSGERLYHPAALALALTRLLRERVRDVTLCQVGGTGSVDGETVPALQGATDTAEALIVAARQKPQAILVITDGYENIRQGDAEQVVQAMRQLGLTVPIYQVVPLFTTAEKLTQRCLGKSIPVIPVEHENGVRELLAYTLLASTSESVSQEGLEQLQNILFAR